VIDKNVALTTKQNKKQKTTILIATRRSLWILHTKN